jgi:hypothetical protein
MPTGTAQPTLPSSGLQEPPQSPVAAAAGSGSSSSLPPVAAGSGTPSAGPAGSPALGSAGRGAPSGAAGAPPSPAAGSGATLGAISGLTFDVTTAPVGYRYQPRNIGAIWVQDANGKFVKSLEVWAGIRARYLTKFSGARAGQSVDVTASATLTSHKAHHASWAMKDRSGAAAAPGKYSLIIELTDGDQTGKFLSVDFDTSLGPQTISPMETANFKTMKLELK